MFENLRHHIKKTIKERDLSYAQIAESAEIKLGTIKSFMSGANDSRRIAERLADLFSISLIYSNGCYDVLNEEPKSSVNKIDMPDNFIAPVKYQKGCNFAQVIQVIKTLSVIGTGKIDDPVREITQYWTLDSKHLVTIDEFISSKEENEKNREKSC